MAFGGREMIYQPTQPNSIQSPPAITNAARMASHAGRSGIALVAHGTRHGLESIQVQKVKPRMDNTEMIWQLKPPPGICGNTGMSPPQISQKSMWYYPGC